MDELLFDGGALYWLERRPSEAGRQVIVRSDLHGSIADILPSSFNARTRVHEYGGGSYTVSDGIVYFINNSDQAIYKLESGNAKLLYSHDGLRFADLLIDKQHQLLICVCEDHRNSHEVLNSLISIPLAGGDHRTIAYGHDFYSSPALSPDGRTLAWLSWDHPDMPWDTTMLWSAALNDEGTIDEPLMVAGGNNISIFQPQWSPDGRLYFVSDEHGYWNIWRLDSDVISPLADFEYEFGVPQWSFAMSTYAFDVSGQIFCAFNNQGLWSIGMLCVNTGKLLRIDTPYTDIKSVRALNGMAGFIGGSPTQPHTISIINLDDYHLTHLRTSIENPIDHDWLSKSEAISFKSENGIAHGFFYPPTNPNYAPLPLERPPLIVFCHGGPTAASTNTLNLRIQYWTSRGFAVFDVNYRGSTGYGRTYRQALNGQWGILDVADCAKGAQYLTNRGDVDDSRLIIRGSSAGGYTCLCALTFTSSFKAGASLYGIGDLEALLQDTHKFESHYLDRLIGPWPQAKQRYHDRSPRYHASQLSCPIIFMQGLDDKVVPPAQAEAMVTVLREKHLPVAYLVFEGEQHGFRKAQTITHALESEHYFYTQIFGIPWHGTECPVTIENL